VPEVFTLGGKWTDSLRGGGCRGAMGGIMHAPLFGLHSGHPRSAARKARCLARVTVLCVILFALNLIFTPDCAAQAEAKPPAKAKASGEEIDSPTAKGDRLRRPGFLFLELDCHDLEEAIAFFHDVAGFEINRNDGNFVILRSERGELLLNRRGAAPKGNAPGAPIPKVQGPRVEIGIVVDDLDKAFAAAQKHPAWTIADRIARQSWGVRDFRVWSPERYYLRITEGPR